MRLTEQVSSNSPSTSARATPSNDSQTSEPQNPIPYSEESLSELLLKALARDPSLVVAGGRAIDIPEK